MEKIRLVINVTGTGYNMRLVTIGNRLKESNKQLKIASLIGSRRDVFKSLFEFDEINVNDLSARRINGYSKRYHLEKYLNLKTGILKCLQRDKFRLLYQKNKAVSFVGLYYVIGAQYHLGEMSENIKWVQKWLAKHQLNEDYFSRVENVLSDTKDTGFISMYALHMLEKKLIFG